MVQVERYNMFALSIHGDEPTDSNVKVDFTATFSKEGKEVKTKGFYSGNGEYIVRFMPEEKGTWHYEAVLKVSEEVHKSGDFECIGETGNNHGPVIADGMNFKYADGTKYIPIGTTIYAWIHQPKQLIAKTIETLSNSPFNKVRMCVFPKSMPYNNNEPELFPFRKNEEGRWDVNKPDLGFWGHLETQLKALTDLGIEADLILFHPYDRWNFSGMSREDNITYLDYCVRRLSAFRNIWWSLANEYDMVFKKNTEDWEAFGEFIFREDPYRHLLSIHNWIKVYDATKPWITHCSIQTNKFERTGIYRNEYKKPIVIDECRYEGDIEQHWGNISAFEMVHRFWTVMLFGGYCTHGETFHREDEILWWAKGGELYGKSVKRITFLKEIINGLDGELQPDLGRFFSNPNEAGSAQKSEEKQEHPFRKVIMSLEPAEREAYILDSISCALKSDTHILQYLGRQCRSFLDVILPEDNGEYYIDVIDIWEMTRVTVKEKVKGKVRVQLPGKELR